MFLSTFRKQSVDVLISALPLETEGEQARCISLNKLTVETSLYWLALIEYLGSDGDKSDDLDFILPELTSFCDYVSK